MNLRERIEEAKKEALAQADMLRAGGQRVTSWPTREAAIEAVGHANVYQCATCSWVEAN